MLAQKEGATFPDGDEITAARLCRQGRSDCHLRFLNEVRTPSGDASDTKGDLEKLNDRFSRHVPLSEQNGAFCSRDRLLEIERMPWDGGSRREATDMKSAALECGTRAGSSNRSGGVLMRTLSEQDDRKQYCKWYGQDRAECNRKNIAR